MNRAELVDFYIEKLKEPDFRINQVRTALESKKIPEEEIRIIVQLVDNQIQNGALRKTYNNRAKELIITGAILTVIGLVVTFGTLMGLINIGNSVLIIYGPIVSGLSILSSGYAIRKK